MTYQEHEISAFHEAGHAVCAACFPSPSQEEIAKEFPHLPSSHPIAVSPFSRLTSEDIFVRPSRIKVIIIGDDVEDKISDGVVGINLVGLSNEQQLVITLGGKVAELMAKTEGNWNVSEIQARFSNSEFDSININDMKKAYDLLGNINKSNHTKRSLSEFISKAFSFLAEVWELVDKIAKAVISKYDLKERKAKLEYEELSSEIQALLHQLESSSCLKAI